MKRIRISMFVVMTIVSSVALFYACKKEVMLVEEKESSQILPNGEKVTKALGWTHAFYEPGLVNLTCIFDGSTCLPETVIRPESFGNDDILRLKASCEMMHELDEDDEGMRNIILAEWDLFSRVINNELLEQVRSRQLVIRSVWRNNPTPGTVRYVFNFFNREANEYYVAVPIVF